MHPIRPPMTRALVAFLLGAFAGFVLGNLTDGDAAAQPPANNALADRDVQIDEADVTTLAQLLRAEQAARESQWDEAVDALLRAADLEREKLVVGSSESEIPRGEGFRRYVPVRRRAQDLLDTLGEQYPPFLAAYRQRMDPAATRAFAELEGNLELAPWERWLRNYEQSGGGARALALYGERLLEQGDFHRARWAWERCHHGGRTRAMVASPEVLTRLPTDRSWWWTFRAARRLADIDKYEVARPAAVPHQPPTDSTALATADVAARLVLVSILEGDGPRASWELERFRRQYPEAMGELSGKRGTWSKLLQDQLTTSREWERRDDAGDWSCFARDARRSSSVAASIDIAGRPRWRAELTPLPIRGDESPARLDNASAKPVPARDHSVEWDRGEPPFHPIAWGEHIAIQDAEGVRAWRTQDGAPAVAGSSNGLLHASPVNLEWLESPGVRTLGRALFPLSSAGTRLWARCDGPWSSADLMRGADGEGSRMIALDLASDGRLSSTWLLSAPEFGPEWTWEGPPLVRDGLAFVGLRRSDTVQTQAHVACFDVETGRLKWRRFVAGVAQPRPRRSQEWTQHLLTWHEGRLFYHAAVGVVACLAPRDGAIEWLVRYPRSSTDSGATEGSEAFRRRDLAPCVAYRDLVIVAAADQERVFALEASTGQLIWMADGAGGAEATQLLGVADEHVILSGPTLIWLDIATGQVRAQYPPAGSLARGMARLGPRGFGRGLLAGDEVWWPTREEILVFRARPELTSGGPRPVGIRRIDLRIREASGGNLLIHRGMLYIATADTLYAFGE